MNGLQWSLNSQAPATVPDIVSVLAREQAQWERALDIKLMRNKLAQQEALAANRSPEPEQDSPTERNASHAAAIAQMGAGIEAAAMVAAGMNRDSTTRFHVTICGHVGLDYAGGVEERMQVFVDAATEPRDGW
jgi:hypothetical protein